MCLSKHFGRVKGEVVNGETMTGASESSQPIARDVKFYVALRGDKTPDEYIRLGQFIESLGFDRIYVYDDLMYRPSWPILTLLAINTKKIELGPCVVNGFYCHPAIIAENAAFLDEISEGRSIIGLGRGAFFDFLNMDNSEYRTRKGCEETIQLVRRFLHKNEDVFKGEFFEANKKAVLRWNPIRPDIPLILGSWNEKMARIAGKYCSELQVAGSWNLKFLQKLDSEFYNGLQERHHQEKLYFSIGGMSCISLDKALAHQRAKQTMAVYLPYLKGVISKSGFDVTTDNFKQIERYSKHGQYAEAVPFITDDMVKTFTLSGHPDQVVNKLRYLIKHIDIHGILFSPPYGTAETIEENLQLIGNEVISKLK